MDPKDLLALLDLDGDPPDPGVATVASAPFTPLPPNASLTALAVDAWGLRRGRDLVAEGGRLAAARANEFAAADYFAAAFDPDPRLLPACADPRRRDFLAGLLTASEYAALHAVTRLDDTAAGIAAAHFAEQFARLEQAGKDELPGGAVGAGAVEVAILRAAGRAVTEAGKEVGEMRDAAAALGLGTGEPGSADPCVVAALFKRVRADPGLKRVCDLAGRFRRVAQSRQRMKASHGLDDVVGVEPGGDVSRLLPAELGRLMVPELELDALRRLAERQALCLARTGTEPAGKGPVIVAVDESGSMHGDKAHTAKALALALAWVARKQRRWCALVAYSGDTGERLLPLPPGRWDEARLLDWLGAFLGGGSSIDVPVREMPRLYADLNAPRGVTDLVFLTDARCSLPTDVQAAFVGWKKAAKARLVTLVIDSPPGDLALVSDECQQVPALDPTADAVGRVLSL